MVRVCRERRRHRRVLDKQQAPAVANLSGTMMAGLRWCASSACVRLLGDFCSSF